MKMLLGMLENQRWEKDINLNSKSIGIELVNKGFESFPKKQIVALIKF